MLRRVRILKKQEKYTNNRMQDKGTVLLSYRSSIKQGLSALFFTICLFFQRLGDAF